MELMQELAKIAKAKDLHIQVLILHSRNMHHALVLIQHVFHFL